MNKIIRLVGTSILFCSAGFVRAAVTDRAATVVASEDRAGYSLVYAVELPEKGNCKYPFRAFYTADRSDRSGAFDRVAYYLELERNGETQWVWVSMDAFTDDRRQLAVPTEDDGARIRFWDRVNNLSIRSNVSGVTTGDNLAGKLEFTWTNYGTGRSLGLENASNDLFDFDDSFIDDGSHASMQVHNITHGQTVFSLCGYQQRDVETPYAIGIGNGPRQPDWTMDTNSGDYSLRHLEVYVRDQAAPPPQNPALRILPLGDSITEGVPVPGGYRLPLYRMLTEAGYNAEFVGTYSANTFAGTRHEGHSGWTINGGDNGIRGHIRTWLTQIKDVDVVLLHLGTNDAGSDDTSGKIAKYEDLVSILATERPAAHIIVSSVLRRTDGEGWNNNNLAFNAALPALVARQQALGRRVHFLDMAARLEASGADLADGLHPNVNGYVKMAAAWTDAISSLFDPATGDTRAPEVARAAFTTSASAVEVVFSKPVEKTTAETAANYAVGGIEPVSAALGTDDRTVTLTFAAPCAVAECSGKNGLSVSSVADRAATPQTIDARGVMVVSCLRGVANAVPAAAREGYELLYSFDLPAGGAFRDADLRDFCQIDNSGVSDAPFDRVAYYLELQPQNGEVQTVWVSMAAFTDDRARLTVPTTRSSEYVNWTAVGGLTVYSNRPGVRNGSGFAGKIEFAPYNYAAARSYGFANASDGLFDFDDTCLVEPGNYGHGSMQIHNVDAGQTIFALCGYQGGADRPYSLGIGPADGRKGAEDWTFVENSTLYTVRHLEIYVREKAAASGNNHVFEVYGETVCEQVFADDGTTPATVEILGQNDEARFRFTRESPAMSGRITVSRCELVVDNPAYLGTGPIRFTNGAKLTLATPVDASFWSRIEEDSELTHVILVGDGARNSLDLSRFPGCSVGTRNEGKLAQDGSLVPGGNDYVFGGLTKRDLRVDDCFTPPALVDRTEGQPSRVVISSPEVVNLSNSGNSYSGGTVITGGGAVWLWQTDGLGKTPATLDPANVFVDGGMIRFSRNGDSPGFSLAATRGITVGAGGLRFHPWGGADFALPGGLHGEGPIHVTDSGVLVFNSAQNTWNGRLTAADNDRMKIVIGDGANCSWVSEGGIAGRFLLTVNTDRDVVFNDTLEDNLNLVKKGIGKLTFTRPQPFTGTTVIEAGTVSFAGGKTGGGKIENYGTLAVADMSVLSGGTVSGGGNILVGEGQTLDTSASAYTYHGAVLNGGTLTVPSAVAPSTAIDGFADFQCRCTYNNNRDSFCEVVEEAGRQILHLTTFHTYQAASAWHRERVDISKPWVARFKYRVTHDGSPADGFAFVVQNQSLTALGEAGGNLGFGGNGKIKNSVACQTIFNYNNDRWALGINGNPTARYSENCGITDYFSHSGSVYDFIFRYNGNGRLRMCIRCEAEPDVEVLREMDVDIPAEIGSNLAWVGFTGATGGSKCSQDILSFSFTNTGAATADWALVGDAVFGKRRNELRLTKADHDRRGSAWCKNRVRVDRPFTIAYTYIVDKAANSEPADGVVAVFQNYGTDLLSDSGNYGVKKDVPSFGLGIRVYQQDQTFVNRNGNFSDRQSLNEGGVSFRDGGEARVELAYDLHALTMTVRQGESVVTRTETVDLAALFGSEIVIFGFTGATGGSWCDQWITDVVFSDGLLLDYPTVPVTVMTDSCLDVKTAGASCCVTVPELVLAEGTRLVLAKTAGSAADSSFRVTVGDLVFSGDATLAVSGGTLAAEVIRCKTGGVLTVDGVFTRPSNGGPIRVETPPLSRTDLPLTVARFAGFDGLGTKDFALVPNPASTARNAKARLLVSGELQVSDAGLILIVR